MRSRCPRGDLTAMLPAQSGIATATPLAATAIGTVTPLAANWRGSINSSTATEKLPSKFARTLHS